MSLPESLTKNTDEAQTLSPREEEVELLSGGRSFNIIDGRTLQSKQFNKTVRFAEAGRPQSAKVDEEIFSMIRYRSINQEKEIDQLQLSQQAHQRRQTMHTEEQGLAKMQVATLTQKVEALDQKIKMFRMPNPKIETQMIENDFRKKVHDKFVPV